MVMRGALCITDHMMLRLKMKIGRKPSSRRQDEKGRKLDVARLSTVSGGMKGKDSVRDKYAGEVSRRLKEEWCETGTVEEKWEVMKSALYVAAKSTLATSSQKKVDWFEENAGMLMPMLEKRKEAYLKWLDTGNEREQKKFAELHGKVRRAVRVAKNSWFLRKAQEAEHGMHRG